MNKWVSTLIYAASARQDSAPLEIGSLYFCNIMAIVAEKLPDVRRQKYTPLASHPAYPHGGGEWEMGRTGEETYSISEPKSFSSPPRTIRQ